MLIRRFIVTLLIISILFSGFFSILNFEDIPVKVDAKTLFVGSNKTYSSIQSAINNANPGDTIFIQNGIYEEYLKISKNISLIGESINGTVITGNNTEDVIYVTSSGVTITNLTVSGSGVGLFDAAIELDSVVNCKISCCNIMWNDQEGIFLNNSNNNNISNNILFENKEAIRMYSSTYNSIFNNTISNNRNGMVIDYSNNNTINNNYLSYNINYAILLEISSNNTIINNSLIYNYQYSIYINESNNNTIIHNIIEPNEYGIYIEYSDNNTIDFNSVTGSHAIYLANSNNNSLSNNNLSNNYYAIRLRDSYSNLIMHNNIYGCWGWGISLQNSSNNIISNNYELGGRRESSCIYIRSSMNNTISYNFLLYNNNNIYLDSSNKISLINNSIISDGGIGIYLRDSMEVKIENNSLINNSFFIAGNSIDHWNTHIINENNMVNNKSIIYWQNRVGGTVPPDAGQIILANCTNVTVENQSINKVTIGIELGFSNSIKLSNNSLRFNDRYGLHFYYSDYNTIINSSIYSNYQIGINLDHSNYNNLIDNKIVYTEYTGIEIISSKGNILENNNISNNSIFGAYLHNTSNHVFMNNRIDFNGLYLSQSLNITFSKNLINYDFIQFDGSSVEYFSSHEIDNSNLVNGKPLYFLRNREDGIVPGDAGMVILANCTGVLVENQNISNQIYGLQLYYSNSNTISNNKIINNKMYGIRMVYSDWNKIIFNNISGNWMGIQSENSANNTIQNNKILNNLNGIAFGHSNYNTISSNEIYSNSNDGLDFWYSHFSTIRNNSIINNSNGIECYESNWNTFVNNTFLSNNNMGIEFSHNSWGNVIYSNNFIDNGHPANDYSGGNIWNASYPTGGNFWSDYEGEDKLRGPDQDVLGSDGFGDSPYTSVSSAHARDNYPLMNHIPFFKLISMPPPSAPQKLMAFAGDGYVLLTWSLPPSYGWVPITGYKVYQYFGVGNIKLIANISDGSLRYNDTNVTNGMIYRYMVSAVNDAGEGPTSERVMAKPEEEPEPLKDNEAEDGYQLRYILFSIILFIILVAIITLLASRLRTKKSAQKGITIKREVKKMQNNHRIVDIFESDELEPEHTHEYLYEHETSLSNKKEHVPALKKYDKEKNK